MKTYGIALVARRRTLAVLVPLLMAGAMLGGCFPSSSSDTVVDAVPDDDGDTVTPSGSVSFGNEALDALAWGPDLQVTAFFPGYANWQWLTSVPGYTHDARAHEAGSAHAGASGVNSGLACTACHGGFAPAEAELGAALVDLESDAYQKPGSKVATLNAAYDSQFFYLRVRYQSSTQSPTITHEMFRYDGTAGFLKAGGPRDFETGVIDEGDLAEGTFFNYEDRVAVMHNPSADGAAVGHAAGVSFNNQGCFIACHSTMRNQAEEVLKSGTNFDGLPFAAESDVRHYLLATRDTAGGMHMTTGHWDEMAPGYDRAASRTAGTFLDLWQARVARSVPMGHASNDYVIDYRLSGNGGTNNWFDNRPQDYAAAGQPGADGWPRWIYDPRLTGYWAIHEDALHDTHAAGEGPLRTVAYTNALSGETFPQNAIEFEALFEKSGAEWVLSADVQVAGGATVPAGTTASTIFQAGDLIPRRALREASGARAGVETYWAWENGATTVVFKRHLVAQNDSDKTIDLNSGHTMGIALFDDNVSNRSHFISFPFTVGLSGTDLVAGQAN